MVGAGPAILRRHQHSHKAELAELSQRLLREPRLAVPFRRIRREQILRDITRGIAQQPLFLGQSHEVGLIRTACRRG